MRPPSRRVSAQRRVRWLVVAYEAEDLAQEAATSSRPDLRLLTRNELDAEDDAGAARWPSTAGSTPGRALPPGDAVRGFLDALGVAPDRVPPTSGARASEQNPTERSVICGSGAAVTDFIRGRSYGQTQFSGEGGREFVDLGGGDDAAPKV